MRDALDSFFIVVALVFLWKMSDHLSDIARELKAFLDGELKNIPYTNILKGGAT